jgi:hypothetical protein
MSCKKVQYLIEDVREEVEDQDVSTSIGMPDSSYLLHLNDGLSRIHALIVNAHPKLFTEEVIVDVDSSDIVLDIPVDAFMGNKILDVKYSTDGNTWGNVPLLDRTQDRDKHPSAALRGYYRESGKIKLIGRPQASSKIKYVYVKKLPKLGFKAASVGLISLDEANRTITNLTLNTTTDILNNTILDRNTRLTIVDFEGNVKMQNIPYSSYDTSSGVVTVVPGFTFKEGEAPAVGDLVLGGSYTSDTPLIDDYVEKYLISYATMKMLQRDGSMEVSTQTSVLMAMEKEIVDSYSSVSDDIKFIPNINQSLDWTDEY